MTPKEIAERFIELPERHNKLLRKFITAIEAVDTDRDPEAHHHNLFFYHDSTDEWLYETGMVSQLGSETTYYDKEDKVVLVFKGDSVAIITENVAKRMLGIDSLTQ